uniref:Uncharacterized protein n=1 Tax=Datisca glomerata TaxID=34297 RepID=H6SWQ2_DATGL|nr:unknown [Datisca glomerata]
MADLTKPYVYVIIAAMLLFSILKIINVSVSARSLLVQPQATTTPTQDAWLQSSWQKLKVRLGHGHVSNLLLIPFAEAPNSVSTSSFPRNSYVRILPNHGPSNESPDQHTLSLSNTKDQPNKSGVHNLSHQRNDAHDQEPDEDSFPCWTKSIPLN